ncbi:isochorismatase family protein [Hymenobacter sp.]|uniref:isochorismatase family protein n=1 Tax=Hymenobacter sp. TaxID=1898978 RepID=UPI00286C625B|nr:isochorismatase family protein [Hymenobacter sp.]
MKLSPQLLAPDNHALVLIDLEGQMGFATHSINITDLRSNTALIAGASRIFNVSTVVTTVVEESFTGPVFPEVEEFYPKATSNYLDRTSMNTWEDEAAYHAITGLGKKKIVLAGLWTSICIVEPALSALADGYEVYVVADVCGDVTLEAHDRAMQRMIHAGVQPVTALQYLLELQRDWARTETYAPVMDLVKKYGGSYGLGVQYAQHMLQPEAAPA